MSDPILFTWADFLITMSTYGYAIIVLIGIFMVIKVINDDGEDE